MMAVPEPADTKDDACSPVQEFSNDSRSTPLAREVSKKKLLKYKVLIHVDNIEEESDLEEDGNFLVPPLPISDKDMSSPLGCYGGGRCGGRRALAGFLGSMGFWRSVAAGGPKAT
jgi:hypothetical protein